MAYAVLFLRDNGTVKTESLCDDSWFDADDFDDESSFGVFVVEEVGVRKQCFIENLSVISTDEDDSE